MAPVAPETLNWLREVYTNCGPFSSNRELAAVFVDARISPWRDDLPEADSRIDRIDALISYLHDSFSTGPVDAELETPENALVLFTQVLSERTPPEDACYDILRSVAQRLQEEISRADITADDVVTGRVPSATSVSDAALLDDLIRNQMKALRSYRTYAISLILLGLLVFALGFMLSGQLMAGAFRSWISVGGMFIASLSLIQYREVLERKEKINLFTTMKDRIADIRFTPDYIVFHERIDQLVWQVIEHAAIE